MTQKKKKEQESGKGKGRGNFKLMDYLLLLR